MSCVPTPTATETTVITSTTGSVSTSTSLTTSPDVTRTSVVTSCILTNSVSGSGAAGSCLATTEITSTTVIQGGVATVQVPITVDQLVTVTSFQTLFGTSCSRTPDPPSPPPSPPPSSPLSISTPPPEVIVSQSSTTLADGSVAVTSVTITSTLPPVSVYVSATLPPGGGQSTQQDSNSSGSSANLGPIIGGTVGGFFGLIGIVALIWFIMKRRSRWDDIFDKEEEEVRGGSGRFSLDVEPEPKPYQYGLVGHVPSPQIQSPPNSPPLGPVGAGAAGPNRRQPSVSPAPLSLSPSFTTSGHSAPPTTTHMSSMSSRPSSAGSMQPLWPASQQQQQQQQGRPTNEFGVRPPSIHSHSQSSSISSPPTTFANWGNNNITGTGSFMGAVALGGSSAAAAEDSNAHRTGSPVSIQEPPRRLQLMNPTPASAASSIYERDHHRGLSNDTVMSGAVARPPSRPTDVNSEFDPYAPTSIDTPLVQGAADVIRTNTKGIVTLDPPSREVRVATDGGRVQASGSGSNATAGPSASRPIANDPPAYEE